MDWVAWMDDPLHPVRRDLLARRGEPDTMAVSLVPGNEDIAVIYMLTRHQVITIGQGQPVDLNLLAVKLAMDLHGITDQHECLTRVRALWHACEERRRQHAD